MKLNAIHGSLTLLCLAATTLMPVPVSAQSAAENRLDPVDVRAPRSSPLPRFDVSRTCPDYATALKTSLARQIPYYIDTPAEMKVEFELTGNEVTSVQTQGGIFEYRRPLRRAVQALDCINDGQAHQKFSFLVVFKPDDGSTLDQAIAIKSLDQVLAQKD